MMLFHFSEDPHIKVFKPRESRALPGLPEGEKLVWAIDEWHSPMYFFPRECPRVLLWALDKSTEEDVQRWIGRADLRMAAFVEREWLQKIEECELYRYTFDGEAFTDLSDAGMHVSHEIVEPMSVEAVGFLPEALMAAKVELQMVESLQPFADAKLWESSLHFSGIRLRNAREWRLEE